MNIRFAHTETCLGPVLVAVTDQGLRALLLGDKRQSMENELRMRFPHDVCIADETGLKSWLSAAQNFLKRPEHWPDDLPLDVCGSMFQRKVWEALRQIPLGETVTYSDIAERIGAPGSVRAVAGACAANALAVLIPCHRVIRRDGSLSGYFWGVERKRALLAYEQALVSA